MPLIKSNSSLVGVDNASISNNIYSISFLEYIQSISLDIKTNRISHNFLNDKSKGYAARSQFQKPEIIVNLNFLQKVDFKNEQLLGFDLFDIFTSTKSSLHKIGSGFNNKNMFILLSDQYGGDFLDLLKSAPTDNFLNTYFLDNDNLNNSISISLQNIYITSYSFSYSIGQLPIVNCAFAASDFKIAKLIKKQLSSIYLTSSIISKLNTLRKTISNIPPTQGKKIIDNQYLGSQSKLIDDEVIHVKCTDDQDIALLYSNIKLFFDGTNTLSNEVLVYHMKNLKLNITDVQGETTIGETLTSFDNSIIDKFDFSLDLSRKNYHFFREMNDDNTLKDLQNINRMLLMPINLSIKISGFSKNFNEKDLTYLYNKDNLFDMNILLGNNLYKSQEVFDFTDLRLDRLKIENFNYTIDVNGLLRFELSAIALVDKFKGFNIFKESEAGIGRFSIGGVDQNEDDSLLDKNNKTILVRSDY